MLKYKKSQKIHENLYVFNGVRFLSVLAITYLHVLMKYDKVERNVDGNEII